MRTSWKSLPVSVERLLCMRLPGAALSAEPSPSVTPGREGRDPIAEPWETGPHSGRARPGAWGSRGEAGVSTSRDAPRRHSHVMGAVRPLWRWALHPVTALCTSCWSLYSGPSSGWGSCFPPWILRSLPWWRLGLYLQWICRHTERGDTCEPGCRAQ